MYMQSERRYTILPVPKSVVMQAGQFDLRNQAWTLVGIHDYRVMQAVDRLQCELADVLGTKPILRAALTAVTEGVVIAINTTLSAEAYTIEVTLTGVTLRGGDAAGCFYGIQTLRQMIGEYGACLPAAVIKDSPDMSYRGFYHDATRGRVPSVKGLKDIVDRLSYYKYNSLQLYVEHPFAFAEFDDEGRTEEDMITPADLLEIDQYCYDRFIDFIPSLSTFGHLYELLSKPAYQHLCELENFEPTYHFWRERMAHHTIDPCQEESAQVIFSLIDQYLPLFRSQYFNICCDETFDLGRGRNIGKDVATLYCDFVTRIIEHVQGLGKTVMMWGDIVLEHPDSLQRIPADTVMLNWDYSENPTPLRAKRIAESGLTQILCPGTWSWYSLIEMVDQSVPNISRMARIAGDNRAMGLLNTNWGDFGHPASFECALYGMLLGACLSWDSGTTIDETFELAATRSLWGVDGDLIADIRLLGQAHRTASWQTLFDWNHTRDTAVLTATEEQALHSAEVCQQIVERWREAAATCHALEHILTAAQGIALLNRAVADILAARSADGWRADMRAWFAQYEQLWLQGNKRGELAEIGRFFEDIRPDL